MKEQLVIFLVKKEGLYPATPAAMALPREEAAPGPRELFYLRFCLCLKEFVTFWAGRREFCYHAATGQPNKAGCRGRVSGIAAPLHLHTGPVPVQAVAGTPPRTVSFLRCHSGQGLLPHLPQQHDRTWGREGGLGEGSGGISGLFSAEVS